MSSVIEKAVVQSLSVTAPSRDRLPALQVQIDLLHGEPGREVPLGPVGEAACKHLNLIEEPEVEKLVRDLFDALDRAVNSKLFGSTSAKGRQI